MEQEVKAVKTEEKVEVTFTPEQEALIAEKFVRKEDFDKVVGEYHKLIKAFNKLLEEYNALHVRSLIEQSSVEE